MWKIATREKAAAVRGTAVENKERVFARRCIFCLFAISGQNTQNRIRSIERPKKGKNCGMATSSFGLLTLKRAFLLARQARSAERSRLARKAGLL